MLHDIEKHIQIVEDSLAWAKEHGKDTFPAEMFRNHRRQLKRIYAALNENCSAAAYGESQVGKSYLMSSLLSSANAPFVINNNGKAYSFIDDINPSGGNNSMIESTGVITRFTLSQDNNAMRDFVKVRNLTVVDIILLIVDSYYNDIKIDQDNVLRYDDINKALEEKISLWAADNVKQNDITEDDIKDIAEYIHDVIGNAAAGVNQSSFCRTVAPIINRVASDKWVEIFSLLWNRNAELSRLFSVLINEYKKIGFNNEVYVPFSAVLREKGTLLKIDWLDTVCDINANTSSTDEKYTDVFDANGNVLARDFHKGYLSALIAELTFELPSAVADDRKFLHKLDLLDFPGARSREKLKEQEIQTVLPKILRRGKVAYLFNKYSRSLRISSVLFCHHNTQKAEATTGNTINSWIEANIGATPEERTLMLNDTFGISPLFLIATKFNIDLEKTKSDSPDNAAKLENHWRRFDTVLPEIISPSRWLDDWVVEGGLFKSKAFQNIYPLRDFYWSGKNQVFDGYSDGNTPSPETAVHTHADYPDYFADLRQSFLSHAFVRKHFANPEQAWDNVATVNNDGSKAIIRNLDTIASVLDGARRNKYMAELKSIKDDMCKTLSVYFEPEDDEAKNLKVKTIASDIKRSLIFSVGERPEIFGHIIDHLMVSVSDIRSIAYDIIICHTETPVIFSFVDFIRKIADIKPEDDKQAIVRKLCDYFSCDEACLEADLKARGSSLHEVVSSKTETLTTVASVVAKHITDYWTTYINSKVKVLEPMLPHADEVVFMLSALMKKMEIRRILTERIELYCNNFNITEQPNVIADFATLTLNNFVSTVGRKYMTDADAAEIQRKADKCNIKVTLDSTSWSSARKPQPLLQTLSALDAAADMNNVGRNELMKLPLWDNFQRWENMVTAGLLYASDISHVDPLANAAVKELMQSCNTLYNNL